MTHPVRPRFRLAAAFLVIAALAGCRPGKSAAPAAPDKDVPPHGGTVVVLGTGIYRLELVLDSAAGRMDAYVLDSEVENFIRTKALSFELMATVGGEKKTLTFRAVPNPATGETVGDTSQFEAEADWLRTVRHFDAVLTELPVRGTAYSNISFKFPEGNDAD